AALVLAVVPTAGGVLPTGGTWDQALASLMASLVGLLLAAVGLGVLFRYLGNVPGLSRLVLADAQANAATAPATPHVAGMDVLGDGHIAVGDTGTVVSPCRPAGEANINGRLVDVTSNAGFLEPGTEVRVTETTRFSITVDTV
ncbi:MAG: NfeD family protein, partial [Planctomycetota bacterium]